MNRIFRMSMVMLVCFLCFSPFLYCAEDSRLYKSGRKAARVDQRAFAFMDFRLLLETYPDSKFRQPALFAVGEYYLEIRNFADAEKMFQQFVRAYPDAEENIFALMHLFTISRQKGAFQEEARFKKEIAAAQRITLFFREYKIYRYRSALNRNYRAHCYIDRIEFYIDEEFLSEILY